MPEKKEVKLQRNRDDANKTITGLIQEIVDRNRESTFDYEPTPLVTIVDAEVGIGKSYALKQYVKNSPQCRTLIFLESTKNVMDYASELNGLAIHSSDGDSASILDKLKRGLEAETPVVVMTHAALQRILQDDCDGDFVDPEKFGDGDGDWMAFQHFDLFVVDEMFSSLIFDSYRYDDIAELLGSLYLLDVPAHLEVMEVIKKAFDNKNNKAEIINFTESEREAIVAALKWILGLNSTDLKLTRKKLNALRKFLVNLASTPMRTLYSQSSNNNSPEFISVQSYFPKSRSLLILADGSSKVATVLGLQKYPSGIETKVVKLRHVDWSSHTFHVERGPSGKGFINKLSKADKKKLVGTLVNFNRGLVLSHKDLVEELDKDTTIDQHEFLHWGQHRGTNDFSGHSAMYIPSIWWQPPTEYSSKYFAEVDAELYRSEEYEELDLPSKALITEIKQAIGRINRNGEHKNVDVYIRLPEGTLGDTLIKYLQAEFIGASFNEASWCGIGISTKDQKVIDLANKVGQGFPDNSSAEAHGLNSFLDENERKTLADYRSKSIDKWSTFIDILNNDYHLTIKPFDQSGRPPKAGKRPTPNTLVIYK